MKSLFKIIVALALVTLMAITVYAHECNFQPMRNDASHWEECLECGEFRNAESHTFENNICAICGIEKNEGAVHSHSYTKMRNDASHWEECLECGEYRNAESHTFENDICTACGIEKDDKAVHYHTFTKMRNDASHWEECLECGEYRNAESHTFEKGVCTGCGIDEPVKVDSHDHLYVYEKSLDGHWRKCRVCNQTKDSGAHNFSDGSCADCGMLVPNNPFKDVTDEDWFYTDVLRAYAFGLVNGKNSPDTFCPDDYMTYAEAIKLAACMNELYTTGKVTLTNGTPWYQSYVDYCRNANIITKDYDFGALATRQGYMEIFANALPDSALEVINNIPENFVPDVPSSNEYAEAIYKLYRAGILAGVDSDHNCNPTANIKRREVAAIISRMMDETQRLLFTKFDNDSEVNDETNDETDDKVNDGEEVTGDQLYQEFTGGNIEIKPIEGIVYGYVGEKYTYTPGSDLVIDSMNGELRIERQPASYEAEAYGMLYELYVDVKGGKAPYKYEWFYNGYRNQKTVIANGDYVKDATTEALILAIEKENTLLGETIFCKITDSEGTEITSNNVEVFGPFSMPVDTVSIEEATKKYSVVGRIADGKVKKDDKVSIVRNGKVIAIGVASDLTMFNKSIDECTKGDNVGVTFVIEKGVMPHSGDIMIKYNSNHVIDTSDIVN